MNRIQALKLTTSAMVALELVMVFLTEFWPAALVMAAVFGAALCRLHAAGPGTGVLGVLALAFVVELVPLPFYPRDTVDDWVVQTLAGVISAVGLVAAVHSLLRREAPLSVSPDC
jgi:hypothetical protein